jgi:hypothetical protein
MDRFIKFLEDHRVLNQFINNMELGCPRGMYAGHMEYVFTRAHDKDKLDGAFMFGLTPEGYDFWTNIKLIYTKTLNHESTRK